MVPMETISSRLLVPVYGIKDTIKWHSLARYGMHDRCCFCFTKYKFIYFRLTFTAMCGSVKLF